MRLAIPNAGPSDETIVTAHRFSPARLAAVLAAHAALIALLLALKAAPLPGVAAPVLRVYTLAAPQALPGAASPQLAQPSTPVRERHRQAQIPLREPSRSAKPPQTNMLSAAANLSQTEAPAAPVEAVPTASPSAAPASAANSSHSSNSANLAGGAAKAEAGAGAAAGTSAPRFDADYLRNPAPVYPLLARKLGEQGKVVVRVLVDIHGRPTRIELHASSGSPRLDQAAQDAVGQWQFVPARHGDEAVEAWVRVPVIFNLKN